MWGEVSERQEFKRQDGEVRETRGSWWSLEFRSKDSQSSLKQAHSSVMVPNTLPDVAGDEAGMCVTVSHNVYIFTISTLE